ncbi:MAG TPA: hypothetical protein DCR23_03860, partial [Ruminococcaceae bacterium]|nr:hypothetical protein [Oscillospiraceae bacterium]
INNLKPDKTELEKAIADGNEVVGGDTSAYTPESVQALEDAIAAGEAVDADPDATVEEIKAATEAIKDALSDLLEEAVDNAKNTDTTGTTPESQQALEDAIDNAEDVINNPDSTPDDIKNAIDAIEDAINNLKPDKSELADAIADGTEIVNGDTSAYTPASVQALEDAIAAGQTVYDDPDATVQEVKDATDAIRNALENLLEEAIDNAEDIVNNNSDDYTPESIQDLEDAISDAEDVINNPDSTPEEIADAIQAIEDAINNLKPDKSELADAISDGTEIVNGDTSAYTPASVQALEDAIAAGQTVYDDPDATVQEIKDATDAIRNALEDLLEEAVDNAKNTDTDGMTPDSAKDLEDAINNAEDVINNPDSTPDDIKNAIDAIEDAINNLKPDKTELEKAITAGNEVLGGDTEKFTPESVQALEDAIAHGEAVDADPDATVEEIKAATEAIKDALNNLLEEAVDDANAKDPSNYTPESAQALEDAVDAAEAVLNNPDSTPEEIADAIKALEDVLDSLELTKITPKDDSAIIVDRPDVDTDYTYLVGLDPEANSVDDLKAKLENDGTTIIVLRNDVELTGDELVGTGCIVKCVAKSDPSIVYEVATVVLYGDVNGDGLIDDNDYQNIKSTAFVGARAITPDTVYYFAADLNGDKTLDAFDCYIHNCIMLGCNSFNQGVILFR